MSNTEGNQPSAGSQADGTGPSDPAPPPHPDDDGRVDDAGTPTPNPEPLADTAAMTSVTKLLRGEVLPPGVLALIVGPVGRAVAEAADFAANSLADATLDAYAADWRHFVAWCHAGDITPLPASPVVVAGYLATLATTLKRSGLKRRLAAIAHHHRAGGHAWQPGHPAIRATLRGILREHGVPARPAAALTSEEIKRLLGTCGTNLAGIRDRALFLIGFAGALRRSELVAVDREHLRFTDAGLTLLLPHSKADPEKAGVSIGIPRFGDRDTCPVRALDAWLRRSGIEYGPVFRKVSAAGRLEARLTADGVWKILRRHAAQAGLTVHPSERLSPHGLRAGFITEAYLRGALDEQVMQHVRHKDITTTRGYRRRVKLLVETPASLLDL